MVSGKTGYDTGYQYEEQYPKNSITRDIIFYEEDKVTSIHIMFSGGTIGGSKEIEHRPFTSGELEQLKEKVNLMISTFRFD